MADVINFLRCDARERVDGRTDQTTPSHRNNKLSENNFIIEMSKEHTGAIIIISRACKYKSRLVGSGTSSINYCDALYGAIYRVYIYDEIFLVALYISTQSVITAE